MYFAIKNSLGRYLAEIDHSGIKFSSFVEEAIVSHDRNDIVHLSDFLLGFLYSSDFHIVKLSSVEEKEFLLR